MDLYEYLNELNKAVIDAGIKRSDVLISHGGASIIFGFRKSTEDIDIAVNSDNFNKVVEKLGLEVKNLPQTGDTPPVKLAPYGNVDFHDWGDGRPNAETFSYRGYLVTTRKQLLIDRIELGREKDMGDILLLKEFWGKIGSKHRARLNELLEKHDIKDEAGE